jgi:carbonic anhydrase
MFSPLPGVHLFHRDVFPQQRERFEELANGQKPSTLFITCSDSRIVPEMLTQTGPGELFVLRNAGNLVPPYDAEFGGEAATIEYAVKALGVEQIVVCGHSHCGAITGVLRPERIEGLPAVEKWLTYAKRVRQEIVESDMPTDPDDDVLTSAIKSNVLVQLDHLRTYPGVAEAEQEGRLSLFGWFYRFETGQVFQYDNQSEEFVNVIESVETYEVTYREEIRNVRS